MAWSISRFSWLHRNFDKRAALIRPLRKSGEVLVGKPGPELRAWLETDPFSLRRVAAPGEPATAVDRPAWFTPDWKVCEVRQNPEGRFILVYSAAENLLYATDSGHGFTPPARAP
jgi:hypothetical protein